MSDATDVPGATGASDAKGSAGASGATDASNGSGMDLEWLSLEDDEEVLWASGPDRRTLVPALVIGIPLSIILIGVFVIVGEYLRVKNTHYVVTTRGLYRKKGVLSRDVKRVEFEKVQNISYSQSALGAQFGYGTVEVSTAGSDDVELEFRSIPDPQAVQRLIRDRLSGDDGDDRDGPDDVLDEIVRELRAIRAILEGESASAPESSAARKSRPRNAEDATPWGDE